MASVLGAPGHQLTHPQRRKTLGGGFAATVSRETVRFRPDSTLVALQGLQTACGACGGGPVVTRYRDETRCRL